MRVLLVEDDARLGPQLKAALEAKGYAVDLVGDGAEAEMLGANEPYDLVLLDLVMKGMNGLDVLSKLTQMDGGARVVVLSADVQESSRQLATEAGAAGFLTKPIDRIVLLNLVAKTLELHA
jgi:two-component system OmpR family response regulator